MRWQFSKEGRGLQKTFAESRLMRFPNALDEDSANALADSLSDLDEGCIWYQSSFGAPFLSPKTSGSTAFDFSYRFEKYPVANIGLKGMIGASADCRRLDYKDVLQYGERPEEELPSSHPLRKFGRYVNSNEGLAPFSGMAKEDFAPNSVSCFASRYCRGDYLTTHDDTGPQQDRVVGFVLNLTRNWEYHWGGQTVYFRDEDMSVGEIHQPQFNTLTVFAVPIEHCVLPISIYAERPRYAISGWMHERVLSV